MVDTVDVAGEQVFSLEHFRFDGSLDAFAAGESGGAFDRDVLADEEQYDEFLAFKNGAPPSLRPKPINLENPVEVEDYEQEMEVQMEADFLSFKEKRAARAKLQPAIGAKVKGVKQRLLSTCKTCVQMKIPLRKQKLL